ncbi:apolipoprotein d [Plakobranchus ocellatus]|uniref:Apolipoprotein D n=1 Tax=Plakobranchus ocellatus TaxID=259542 RepID=A0AAV3XXJ5_9GAST|nr:apolipoprotein d [Plakobranchus ocellatus]
MAMLFQLWCCSVSSADVALSAKGQCINAARYCSTLDRLKEAICRKRPGLLRRGVVCFQHDNATPHSANLTQQWLQRYGWEILPHPAHNPDLAPSDFHLFGPLKRHLGGMAFETEDYLISELRNWFDNLDVDFFRMGINSLLSGWQNASISTEITLRSSRRVNFNLYSNTSPVMAHWSFLSLLLLASLGSLSKGGGALGCVVMHFGTQCPEPAVQDNFDLARYMGRWFEYEKFPNYFEMGAKCVVANYTLYPDNSVRVVNVAVQEVSYGTGICPWYRSNVAVGNGIAMDPQVPAKLGVQFSENAPRGDYWVIETDYDTYSVVYACTKMPAVPIYTEVAWVLTREREVAPPNLDQIKARLTRQGIDVSYFQLSDHKGCPEWPGS